MRSRSWLFAMCAAILATAATAPAQVAYPAVPVPPENPITPEKAILGKFLFWEEQMSSDNTMACGTCHHGDAGGSDPRSVDSDSNGPGPDGVPGTGDDFVGSKGVVSCDPNGNLIDDGLFFPNVQVTGRKTPSMMDAMFAPDSFWDGRATSEFRDPVTNVVMIASGGALESQAVGPPVDDIEMACMSRNWNEITGRLATVKPMRLATNLPPDMTAELMSNATYPDMFNAAFGDPAITPTRIAFAIATYERTLKSDQTPFHLGTLTPQQQMGKMLFEADADINPVGGSRAGNCTRCHSSPMLADHEFHNLGMGDPLLDPGRMNVTGNFADRGKFKTPVLLNVGLREAGGLFHSGTGNGVSLEAVLNGYEGGSFGNNDNLDPEMEVLVLTAQDMLDIVEFLRNGLTDPRVAAEMFPFDRPTLYSERFSDMTPFNDNPQLIGFGAPGTGEIVPTLIARQPPNLQHPKFTIGVANALGGAQAFFAFGGPDPFFGALEVPGAPGVHPFVDLNGSPLVVSTTLNGPAGVAGAGFGEVSMGLPPVLGLAGIKLFGQVFIDDGGAMSASPISATRGLCLELFDVASSL